MFLKKMLCAELRLEKDRPTWLSQRKDEPVFLNKTKAPPPKKKYKWVMNKQTPSVRHTCKREPHLIALVPRKKGKKKQTTERRISDCRATLHTRM